MADLGDYDITPQPAPLSWRRWLTLALLDQPVPPCPRGLRLIGRVLTVIADVFALLMLTLYAIEAWQWRRWTGELVVVGVLGGMFLLAVALGDFARWVEEDRRRR